MAEMITAVVPDEQGKIIGDPATARRLIRSGFTVIDIKPKKEAARETVFVFRVNKAFNEALEKIEKEKAVRRAEKKADK